jgi:hypothetical protein
VRFSQQVANLNGMRARNPTPDEILEVLKSENVLDDYLARPAYQQKRLPRLDLTRCEARNALEAHPPDG